MKSNIFLLNDEEAAALTGKTDLEEIANDSNIKRNATTKIRPYEKKGEQLFLSSLPAPTKNFCLALRTITAKDICKTEPRNHDTFVHVENKSH